MIDELMAPCSSPVQVTGGVVSVIPNKRGAAKLGRAREIASCTEDAWRVCEGPGGRLRPACPCSYLKANLCRPVQIVHASREAPGDSGHGGTEVRLLHVSSRHQQLLECFSRQSLHAVAQAYPEYESMKTHPVARHVSKVDCGYCC